RASLLWSDLQERRCGSGAAPRSWLAVHERSFPAGDRVPRDQVQSGIRACAGGQRLRRARHPHAQGTAALGEDLRYRRGTAARTPGVGRAVQRTLDDPAPRLYLACPAAARSEEHTSELQSRENLVCRLLLEKKNSNMAEQLTETLL